MKLSKKHGGFVLIAVVIVIGYFVWKKYSGQRPPVTTATGIPGAQYS